MRKCVNELYNLEMRTEVFCIECNIFHEFQRLKLYSQKRRETRAVYPLAEITRNWCVACYSKHFTPDYSASMTKGKEKLCVLLLELWGKWKKGNAKEQYNLRVISINSSHSIFKCICISCKKSACKRKFCVATIFNTWSHSFLLYNTQKKRSRFNTAWIFLYRLQEQFYCRKSSFVLMTFPINLIRSPSLNLNKE